MGIRLRLRLQFSSPGKVAVLIVAFTAPFHHFRERRSCGVAADGRWRRPADNASTQVQDFVSQKRGLAGCSRDHLMHDADDGEPAACRINPVGQLYSFLLFCCSLRSGCGPPCSKGISLAREAVAHGIPKWAY